MNALHAPGWLRGLLERYHAGAAHLFLLHGAVADLHRLGDAHAPLTSGLAALAERRPLSIRYDVAGGLSFPDAERERAFRAATGYDEPLPSSPGPALVLIDAALRSAASGPAEAAVVLDGAHHIAPALPVPADRASVAMLARWGSDPGLAGRRPLIVLIAPAAVDVSAEVTSGGGAEAIGIPRPAREDRLAFLGALLDRFPDAAWELSPAQLARATGGLSLLQCEDLVRRARVAARPLALEEVTRHKLELLRREYGDVLEIVEPRGDLSAVGGHAHARRELAEIASLLRAGRRTAVPMGIALMGPPGTGKSHLAACFAGECGLPCVRFRPLRQMYVGQSERNQERAFEAIRALAPVVVIVDESDQAEGGRRDAGGGDSGVGERMRGAAFAFWGDATLRGEVLRIDITNRVDLIDPAMRRSGRTDVKIPILMPDAAERAEILAVLARRLELPTPIADFSGHAERASGLSGSDLELALTSAYRLALREDAAELLPRHLDAALEDILPAARDQAALDHMTLIALDECRNRRLLPPNADEIRAEIQSRRPHRAP